MRENLGLSLAYNAIMLPLAVAGFVTPWLAAAAMSSSSLIVMLNSFRAGRARKVGLPASPQHQGVPSGGKPQWA